ncbi:MAG TPA: SIS domain-containing protein, partial [Candidatus Acidoferrum sp.]
NALEGRLTILTIRPLESHDMEAILAIQAACPEIAQWTAWDYDRVARGEMAGWVAEENRAEKDARVAAELSVEAAAEGAVEVAGFLVARRLSSELEILNFAVESDSRRIHAEGYPAGEMKHGPNALIDENLPVVVLATRDDTDPESITRYEKSVSNIKEVKARDGIVISIATEKDHLAREASDHIIELPPGPEILSPLLEIIPLQLLAYHIAVRRGCDVDQPRNLAKSVTVE